MNKICTSIEQSEKLIELGIDAKTADMYYPNRIDIKYQSALPIEYKNGNPLLSQEIASWSLAALLDVLPKNYDKYTKTLYWFDNGWHCEYVDEYWESYIGETADNPVDVCYGMILKLHERRLL